VRFGPRTPCVPREGMGDAMLGTFLLGLLGGVVGGAVATPLIARAVRARAWGLLGSGRVHRPEPARIEGRWLARWEAEGGRASREERGETLGLDGGSGVITLRGQGSALSGRLDRTSGLPGSGAGRLAATYADGILTALFDDGDPTAIARGALVARLLAHGERMRGHLVLSGGPGAPPRVLVCELERIREPDPGARAAEPNNAGEQPETGAAQRGNGAEPIRGGDPVSVDADADARTGGREIAEHGAASEHDASEAGGARAVWRPAPGRSPGGGAEPDGGEGRSADHPRVIDRSRWHHGPGGGSSDRD